MNNPQFKLLCESLGFYNDVIIREYFHDINYRMGQDNKGVAPRTVEYWLNGKVSTYMKIPDDVQQLFINLKQYQMQLLHDPAIQNNNLLFKQKTVMWKAFPQLDKLPCSFLTQTMALVLGFQGNRILHFASLEF